MTRYLPVLLCVFAFLDSSAVLALAQEYLACPPDQGGYLRPLLAIGGRGEIRADGVPTRARIAPTLNAEIAFQIEPGTSFSVIGGPACADGYLWWRVAYAGFVGWTAESSVNERNYYFQASAQRNQSGRPGIARENLGSLRQLPIDLPPVRFDNAEFAPVSVAAATDVPPILLASNDPTRIAHRLEVAGRVVDADLDSSGTYLALGMFDASQNRTYLARFRSFADSDLSGRAELDRLEVDLTGEMRLVGVAAQPPYMLTLHSDDENANGDLLIWALDEGTLLGRVALGMSPAVMAGDSTGLVVAVSAFAGAGAETVLINLPRAEVAARVPAHGVLAWNPYPGSGREQLFIGQADGTVAVYLALPAEAAQPPDIVPARLERLGEVEVFIRQGSRVVGVSALALGPFGQVLAVGGRARSQDTPDDLTVSVAFIDLATFIVSADSLRGEGWREVDQLGFSNDGSALWVSYRTRDGDAGSGVFGIAQGS